MRTPHYSRPFKKDLNLVARRGKDIAHLKEVMTTLVEGSRLNEKYKDHTLKGAFASYRECHIESDWLLIYKLHASKIFFVRTGTHSDLFG